MWGLFLLIFQIHACIIHVVLACCTLPRCLFPCHIACPLLLNVFIYSIYVWTKKMYHYLHRSLSYTLQNPKREKGTGQGLGSSYFPPLSMLYNENIASCTYLVYLLRVFHKRISPPLPLLSLTLSADLRMTSVWPLSHTEKSVPLPPSETLSIRFLFFPALSFLFSHRRLSCFRCRLSCCLASLSCFQPASFPLSGLAFLIPWGHFPGASGKKGKIPMFSIFSLLLLTLCTSQVCGMLTIFPHKWWLSCVQQNKLYVQYVFVLSNV